MKTERKEDEGLVFTPQQTWGRNPQGMCVSDRTPRKLRERISCYFN